MPTAKRPRQTLAALEVRQWLRSWDSMDFKASQRRRRPPESFYIFTLKASDLRALSGIQRRSAETGRPRTADTGIQRAHDKKRSMEIARFVQNGYPWSRLRDTDRKAGTYDDLRKPGWLPTAIVVNFLTAKDRRPEGQVDPSDLIEVKGTSDTRTITLPSSFGPKWRPKGLHPIEVIDGQHRLFAFNEGDQDDFALPVVAFVGLDISWQAYLFWTINIMPSRLNPSLAFDLYPLLRSEDWLERVEGPKVYREARAQELTEVMWSYPESPWYRRINMLGQTRGLGVTQAGWIRGLVNTLIRKPAGRRTVLGGLFTAPAGDARTPLPWNRTQQAAFLVFIWQELEAQINSRRDDWMTFLRKEGREAAGSDVPDPAFHGRNTYLNTEQGVRAYLTIINDLCFVLADELDLAEWDPVDAEAQLDPAAIDQELAALHEQPVVDFVAETALALASFDWRGADAPGLLPDERALKRAFRGSGGYVEFRTQLLRHLGRTATGPTKSTANELFRQIKTRK